MRIRFPQNLDYVSGASEAPVQKALAGRLTPGEVFYDIGANVGFFSLIAARLVGPSGCVCAFEPVTENADAVRANARLNHFEHIHVIEVAVGRDARTEELLLTAWDGGAAIASSAVKPRTALSRRSVRVASLDDLVGKEGLRLPSFVKIDVEGVELEVVQGMLKTIGAWRPTLLYEIDDGDAAAFRRRWQEMDEFVASLGYQITHLDDAYPGMNWHVGHSLAVAKPGLAAS